MNAMRSEYLQARGLESWVLRTAPAPAVTPGAAVTPSEGVTSGDALRRSDAPAPPDAELDWAALRERVAGCTRCALSKTRTQTVFGVGNPEARWFIVGEAPGAEEDRQGEPFVGRAGQLLNSMLHAVGLARSEVYIANVLKCRPPGNRDPAAGESAHCLSYLERQIALVRPRLLLVVGRIAAQQLLASDAPLGSLRQKTHAFGPNQIPLVVTYHPAYLLRSPGEKRKAWEDLQYAREVAARV